MAFIRQYTHRGRHRQTGSSSTARFATAAAASVVFGVLSAPTATAAPDEVWDRLAQCESGGRWNINTGNGYSGGLQFSPRTWRAFGGKGQAHQASRAEQIRVAERVLAKQGWNAWPSCSRKIGARKHGVTTRDGQSKNEATPARITPAASGTYTVRSGDTLGSIARKHGKTVDQLFKMNDNILDSPNRIFVGQRLKV